MSVLIDQEALLVLTPGSSSNVLINQIALIVIAPANSTIIRSDQTVRDQSGKAVSGAEVWVCTQPANVVLGQSQPPSPLASLFTDSSGQNEMMQPLITDGQGRCYFYVQSLAGPYTLAVYNNGICQQVYQDQSWPSDVV